jgi:DNA-directed RNA polymerase specialized sigma24 family protein
MTKRQENEFNRLAVDSMDSVYSTASMFDSSAEVAEDLVQRTYSLAFRLFNTFDQDESFETWITGICRIIR